MRPTRLLLLAVLGAVLIAACGASGAASSAPTPAASPTEAPIPPFDGLVIDLIAKGQAWSKTELEAPAGAPFRILLDNQDKDFYHGIAIAQGETPAAAREAELVYKGDIVPGPVVRAYDVPALEPGTYWFVCQPHANMNGTITVQ
ncbi:MAG TPA: cupredoxin domain-containing protein [Candidatus Sulfomarinibacteraceae bacterium]|nr:cupredoxin domain-containing protein [Candidatus Sulfomarinibacteraceae bacterium]